MILYDGVQVKNFHGLWPILTLLIYQAQKVETLAVCH